MRSGGINGVIRQDGVLRLPDGRQLGYAEYGHPEGELILGFHGVPGTRLMYRPMAAEALRLGLRLVAPDRPGFGLSPPKAGRGLADWLDDVGQLVRHLDARRFSLIGISGGAPFAVATAAHFGERVAALGLIGPIGPVAELGDDI